MFWIAVAILIIVGWIIYLRRKDRITITKKQAEMFMGLVGKEKIELEKKMHDMADNSALQGGTVSVDSPDMPEKLKRGVVRLKQELLDKYGPTIPVNTAHRIMWELDGNGKMWSDHPGCFERHLQRRDGSLLFSPARRIVIRTEIEEAREKDRIEQEIFFKKIGELTSQLQRKIPIGQASTRAQNIQSLMEEAASIGGKALSIISLLVQIEDDLIQQLISAMPEMKQEFETVKALSSQQRIPYMAQIKRKDTPIPGEEQIPALLSEDLETISALGYISRTSAPELKPIEADITSHLEKAVNNGFSTKRADQIISAWRKQSVA